MEWRNRDWFWFTGILIGIMILIIASAYSKSGKLETNFNIIASAVSIALGIVAIFYAGKQDSESRRANENFTTMLQNVLSDVGAVKNQVDKISDNDINQLKEETMEDVKLDEQKRYSQQEVNKLISESLDRFSREFKSKVEENNEINNKRHLLPALRKNSIKRILKEHGKNLTVDEVQKYLAKDFNIHASIATITRDLNDM